MLQRSILILTSLAAICSAQNDSLNIATASPGTDSSSVNRVVEVSDSSSTQEHSLSVNSTTRRPDSSSVQTEYLSVNNAGTVSDSSSSVKKRSLYNRMWDRLYANQNVKFLPSFHIATDISMFFLQKNDSMKSRYYIENVTAVDIEMIRIRRLSSVWTLSFRDGMGRSPGNVVFDPKDVDFGIVPTIEFRPGNHLFQIGLDHHCFHEVDRQNFKTVYWNKGFIGAAKTNFRLGEYWKRLSNDSSWTLDKRLSWRIAGSYYIRDGFGLVDKKLVNGENRCRIDIEGDLRYAFAERRSWYFVGRAQGLFGIWNDQPEQGSDKGIYWRVNPSLEAFFRKGHAGGMIFCTYTLDDTPLYWNKYGTESMRRFSRDRLLQIGIRFFI